MATDTASAAPARLPRTVAVLGWSGVLPFLLPLLVAAALPEWRRGAVAVFVAYGATILAFLGGARWGRALADAGSPPSRYVGAVLPGLLAFAALLAFAHAPLPLWLLAGGFAVWAWIDARDPRWSPPYRRLRIAISAVVLALHAAWAVV